MSEKSALIVIPTTGSSTLEDAVCSAVSQTYRNTEVWVIIDGPKFKNSAESVLVKYPTVKTMVLPANTGSNGWYGHRIYAAVSYLFDHDYILYLDQDNWFEPHHVETMVECCEKNNWQWCHGLRKIHDARGRYICDDDCESLGRWPIYISDQHHLVDTSTYCIRKDIIVNLATAWYSGWGGDRRFYSIISHHVQNFGCTGKATVCYRLDGNPNSVNADFFLQGNQIMQQRYPGEFPWRM
jgi:glycosyltransferase involved in cell wall biosynthesis